jgi:hypothetical protein
VRSIYRKTSKSESPRPADSTVWSRRNASPASIAFDFARLQLDTVLLMIRPRRGLPELTSGSPFRDRPSPWPAFPALELSARQNQRVGVSGYNVLRPCREQSCDSPLSNTPGRATALARRLLLDQAPLIQSLVAAEDRGGFPYIVEIHIQLLTSCATGRWIAAISRALTRLCSGASELD